MKGIDSAHRMKCIKLFLLDLSPYIYVSYVYIVGVNNLLQVSWQENSLEQKPPRTVELDTNKKITKRKTDVQQ